MFAPSPNRISVVRAIATLALFLAGLTWAQSPIEQVGNEKERASPSDTTPGVPTSISMGSGFVVDDGYVMTAWHVVQKYDQILIGPSPAGRWVQGQVVKSDPAQDLALIKVAIGLPPLMFAPSAEVPIGLEVTVVGFPLPRVQGMTRKITQGLINGLQRQSQETTDTGLFQISAEVSMGNSGGPVFAPDGTVVAMVQRKLLNTQVAQQTNDWPTNVNYALRSSALIRFLQGSPARPRISALSLNTFRRPHEIFQAQGASVVSVIGRQAPQSSGSSAPPQSSSDTNRP
jgi:S1-C subfamily serine protease